MPAAAVRGASCHSATSMISLGITASSFRVRGVGLGVEGLGLQGSGFRVRWGSVRSYRNLGVELWVSGFRV